MGRTGVRALFVSAVVAIVVGVACSSYQSDADPSVDAGRSNVEVDSGTGPAGSGQYTGLPCDVQAVLENRCIGCHSGTAPPIPPLLDYGDLVAASSTNADKTRAEIALDRMSSDAKRMPPPPAIASDADERAAFESWIKAGMAKNPTSCTPEVPGSSDTSFDAAAPGVLDAGAPAGTCTSGTKWTDGDKGSPTMHPGGACITCHALKGGPAYRFAGTVFGGLHDVDDCNGTAADQLFVIVTGKNGVQQQIQVAPNGNFFSPVSMNAPYTVSLSSAGKTRKMQTAITAGDCNSCHTAAGANGAPGRILVP